PRLVELRWRSRRRLSRRRPWWRRTTPMSQTSWRMNMRPHSSNSKLASPLRVVSVLLGAVVLASAAAQTSAPKATTAAAVAPASAPGATGPETFESPDKAAAALVDAAEKFDVPSLIRIVGEKGEDVILTDEYARDRQSAQDFAAQARKKQQIARDPKSDSRAYLLVGEEDWPFPLPLVKHQGGWSFDAGAGRDELIRRRVGQNELDAISICHGYVEAQFDYSYRKRQGYEVPQYAQRIIASPGKQDGLAWHNADGSWGGPIGEKIAQAIAQGYN